jgi:hypothetical protein
VGGVPMTTSSPDTSGEWQHRPLTFEELTRYRSIIAGRQSGGHRIADWSDRDIAALLTTLDAATQRAEKAEAALREFVNAYTDIEGDLINGRTDLAYNAARAALLPTDNEGAAT